MDETCDVCKLQFVSATPNKAVADAKILSLGVWGYLCEAHLDYGDEKLTTFLVDQDG